MAQTKGAGCSKRPRLGRPHEDHRAKAFLEVASFLEENDDEQITINDLIDLMEQKLVDTDHKAYSYPYMQTRLREHFGDKIIHMEMNGK